MLASSASRTANIRLGGDANRALPYALLAGDQAEAVFAHGEAEGHYRTAVELARSLRDSTCMGRALEKLGADMHTTARYDEALATLELPAVTKGRGTRGAGG